MKFFKPALLALTLTFFSMGGAAMAGDLSSPATGNLNIGPQADHPAPEIYYNGYSPEVIKKMEEIADLVAFKAIMLFLEKNKIKFNDFQEKIYEYADNTVFTELKIK